MAACGTRASYNTDGCRCDRCRAAERVYKRAQYQRRRARGFSAREARYVAPREPQKLPTWHDDAACRGVNPSLFYGDDGDTAAAAGAKRVCDECPVKSECLSHALDAREKHGVWGGATPDERRTILRKRAQVRRLGIVA